MAAAAKVAATTADLGPPGAAAATGSLTVVPIDEAAPEPARGSAVAAEPTGDPPRAESPVGKSAVAAKPSGPARAGATKLSAPPMAIAAGRTAGVRESLDDEITRAYRATLYDKVLDQCGRGPVSAEHAPWCFLAACHVGNEAKARKLITAVPGTRRDQLVANCRQLGVDVKKPDKPPEDCEADPMACQH